MYKLPIKDILTDAFLIPWNEKYLFINTLAFPILALVSIWATWVLVDPENQLLNITFVLFYFFAFCYFAVACHRLILLRDKSQHSYNTIRILHFLKWFVIIYGISLAIEMVLLTIMMNVIIDFNPDNISELQNFLYLPLMYLVGRFSLIFPATALDLKSSLKWSWKATQNNGINILCIVGLFPWFMYILISLIQRDEPTIIEQSVVALLTYFVSAIGIFALSLTYKALQSDAQKQL
jgi:hypothetical protein